MGARIADVKYDDPLLHRFCDPPRPGSIYSLPDIPQLVRGPTLVLLPSGKEVPAAEFTRQDVAAPAEVHDAKVGQQKLQSLLKILQGKQGPSAPSGFKTGEAPAFNRQREHPREAFRFGRHMGQNLAF